MPNLFPIFEMPELIEQQQTELAPRYGSSWFFDFGTGDFAIDGAGKVIQTDGHTAWAQWCVKTVLTERFAYLAYSQNYGTEIEAALRQPSRQAVEAELERAITEALLVDPRTQVVRDFRFTWEGDQLKVTFTVIPAVGNPEQVEVMYNAV